MATTTRWPSITKSSRRPGGGYSWTFFVPEGYGYREGKHYRLRIDNNGSTDGRESTLYVADIMLVEGTEPRAWAPANGEVWP